jgi:hypothetical protein
MSTLFHYTPAPSCVEGRAYSAFIRLSAIALVVLSAWWWWKLGFANTAASTSASAPASTGNTLQVPTPWILAGLAIMAYTAAQLQVSRTRIDATGLHQTWIWDKHLTWEDAGMLKLIRLRGLEWLIAPRLYTRSITGKLAVFYASDDVLLSEFGRIVEAHAAHKTRLMQSLS